MSQLAKLGIIGWNDVEPTILAACMCRLPVLLVGPHGTNKTEGAARISKAVLGPDIRFIPYDTSLLNSDDFMGYPNPASLSTGKIDYVGTPISIWDADAVLFDEINRANHFTASKLMECIRTRKVMGMDTKVKQVFGAVNPPGEYESSFLDLAMASRWVTVSVPGTKDLSHKDLQKILKGKGEPKHHDLRDVLATASQFSLNPKLQDSLVQAVSKILKSLENNVGNVEPRQGQYMLRLLEALYRLEGSNIVPKQSAQNRVDVILSCVPQAHGVTRKTASLNIIKGDLLKLVTALDVNDTLMLTGTLRELMKEDTEDIVAWSCFCQETIPKASQEDIKDFGAHLFGMLQQGKITNDMFNSLAITLVDRWVQVVSQLDLENSKLPSRRIPGLSNPTMACLDFSKYTLPIIAKHIFGVPQ